MSRPAHFFDLESPDHLFSLLKVVAKRFVTSSTKRTDDLLLLVFGLTHLREWIAPDYSPKKRALKPNERFYRNIYNLDEFKILQSLCNRSKHMCVTKSAMGALYKAAIDDWSDVDTVSDFDRGPAVNYFVNGRDLDEVIQVVFKFYEEQWFGEIEGA